MQSDPIGLDGGMNGYVYVGGNSLIHYDLKGFRGVKVTNPYNASYSNLDYAISKWAVWSCSNRAFELSRAVKSQIDYYQRTSSIYATWYYMLYVRLGDVPYWEGRPYCPIGTQLNFSTDYNSYNLRAPYIPLSAYNFPLGTYVKGQFNGTKRNGPLPY